MDLRAKVALAPYTTFALGGPAALFLEAQAPGDIKEAYALAKQKGLPVVVLGGGSNVVVPDEGLNALVLRITTQGIGREGSTLRCAAGEPLLGLVKYAAGQGLGGLEPLAGIPGTVGGAVRGNAGAFGVEIKDVLVSARALDTETGEEKVFAKSECDFSYRSSFFKRHPQLIVLEAELALAPADPMQADAKIMHTLAERHKRHIQDIRSAGSFFKNPVVSVDLQKLFKQDKSQESKEGRVPAGWLMDRAGLRGARVGGAVASEYHTNYFLNAGDATAAQVKELAALAKEKVFKEFGVTLEEEAVIL
ncbi:MAG: UDP-N-acetylenolpyruvoylglucosamine reductase [Candidatus Adlerbacteria bacterium]|nr:UDP-N-acetylenolpyruvoylglucosamine reductase [Candidatus Adlerbacteria bacterium]